MAYSPFGRDSQPFTIQSVTGVWYKRRMTDEIEITDEMIAAGALALNDFIFVEIFDGQVDPYAAALAVLEAALRPVKAAELAA